MFQVFYVFFLVEIRGVSYFWISWHFYRGRLGNDGGRWCLTVESNVD